ncbi:MAG TPA: hypothetical protein VKR31_09465 [Rhizomicrobium sp.]|nr:hypothetical protein [Rhizomicrobium sp.]
MSVWDMELLLLLHDDPEREWTAEQLVHQLRASDTVVSSGLGRLHTAGIIIQGARDAYRYRSEAPRLDFVVQALANTYRSNPVSVIKMIVGAPDADLRIFSDAFRIRD